MTDMVKKPNHYALIENYEVKDINKALLDRIEESDFDISLYEAGWYQQSMQYFMRFYAKNGLEDLEKGIQTMQFVVDSLKERQENKLGEISITLDKSTKYEIQKEVEQAIKKTFQDKERCYKLYPESD